MIQKRAKQHNVAKMIGHLETADNALCNAALGNALTKRSDEWLRNIIHSLRAFIDEAKRAAELREDEAP